MVNVAVNEVKVSSLNELFSVIKGELMRCNDTQVFISSKLFSRLLVENKHSVIWKEDIICSSYYSDNVEKAFIFCIKKRCNATTFQIHFVNNNLDYIHLVFFACKGILYRHYKVGMNRLLIINSD